MKPKTFYPLLIAQFLLLLACSGNKQKTTEKPVTKIRIYAAAGTRLATEELCTIFEKKENVIIERNYASSGVLARQISNGAQGDIFISANKQWIDFLIDEDLLIDSSIYNIAGNSLAIIAPLNSTLDKPDFTPEFDILSIIKDKIAIGDPSYVPVGKYAKMALDSLDWYHKIKGNIIMGKDVMSVLHYVELGECDWGIVYSSTAKQSDMVKIIAEIPVHLHKPIVFYIAPIKNSQKKSAALIDLFINETGQKAFKDQGFCPLTPTKYKAN
jgi:molybdate transport system substrate-binding protein